MKKRDKEKSKLRKYLSNEVNNKFKIYLNGEFEKTCKEVHDYSDKYNDTDLDLIRAEKFRLQQRINDLISKPKVILLPPNH